MCAITGRTYEYTLNTLNFVYLLCASVVFCSYGSATAIGSQPKKWQERLYFAFRVKVPSAH